jgi:hypothetical protein
MEAIMELIVVFGILLVAYCGFLSAVDFARDMKLGAVIRFAGRRRRKVRATRVPAARAACRAGGAAARWPVPLKGFS